MEDSIGKFFAVWGQTDKNEILKVLEDTMSPLGFAYVDPKTKTPIQGPTEDSKDELAKYLMEFGNSMPGGKAEPVSTSIHHNCGRVTVDFLMKTGDDGEMKSMMFGQYFIEFDSIGKISRITGFPGMGGPTTETPKTNKDADEKEEDCNGNNNQNDEGNDNEGVETNNKKRKIE